MRPHIVLLTGASGFVGKVALEALVRRRDELGIERIVAVIRSRGKRAAASRFEDEVVPSPCFRDLPAGWQRMVTVLDGDLSTPEFGRDDTSQAVLSKVTHIMHAAASVAFDLPVRAAATANITSTENLLALAREMPLLERFTYVSTAYVTPNGMTPRPILEQLAPLPEDATGLLKLIHEDPHGAEAAMQVGGFPNTYTFTKAISEHLLLERCGHVKVSIVRPSIITAARQHPFPGWIDSTAAFGAFVVLMGVGAMRVVIGNPKAKLDIVAVDDVVDTVIEEAFADAPHGTIRHATAGIERAPQVGTCFYGIRRYFKEHPVAGRPKSGYIGTPGLRTTLAEFWMHTLPLKLARFLPRPKRREAERAKTKRDNINAIFPYFTSRSFDFRSAKPMAGPLDTRAFVHTICRGMAIHVLGRDEHEWVLAGRRETKGNGSLRWVLTRPHGNAWIRFGAWLNMKLLHRVTERVTVDVQSFERAVHRAKGDSAMVLLPTHRSYLDFILVSLLAFARPDLKIRIPQVAAAIEFGNIPIIGRILRFVHAFYVRRGASKDNRELMDRVHKLLQAGDSLEFFLEGERSRSRAFLSPKRGLLRAVATCGRASTLLPIAISYDRIPEEGPFLRELRGGPRPRMSLGALTQWLWQAFRNRVQLGRIHIECGEAITIDGNGTADRLGELVIERQKAVMGVSSFHLDVLAAAGVPLPVRAAIERNLHAKGRTVMQSGLPVPEPLDPTFVETIEAHCSVWMDPEAPAEAKEAGELRAG